MSGITLPERARGRAAVDVADETALSSGLPDNGHGDRHAAATIRVETIVERWLSALAAAESAVHAAAKTGNLTAAGAAQRLHHLQVERADVAALLRPLAHGHHGAELLLRCLNSRASNIHLLGLPDRVTACIFDVEGVLTTSAAAHRDAWRATLDAFLLTRAMRLGREFVPFDPTLDYVDHLAGRPRIDGLRSFLASRGISVREGEPTDRPDTESVHGLANRKEGLLRHYLEEKGTDAFAGSRAYLEIAHVVGARTAVVSASENTALVLERAGIAQLVDERIDGRTMALEHLEPKPAPDTLLAACRHLEVDPGEAAAFETTPAGIAAARAAGIRAVVAVAREESTAELAASDADLVIGDLGELLALVSVRDGRP
jgi:HAD superfamily hydrolase (TIGR01509 family)